MPRVWSVIPSQSLEGSGHSRGPGGRDEAPSSWSLGRAAGNHGSLRKLTGRRDGSSFNWLPWEGPSLSAPFYRLLPHLCKGDSHACLSRSSKDERKCAQCLGLADAQDLGAHQNRDRDRQHPGTSLLLYSSLSSSLSSAPFNTVS